MRMHNRVCRKVDPPIPLEEVAEWFPEHRRWDVKDKAVDHLLVVFLMNDCPSDWKYNEDVITCNLFMEILNDTWRHHFILGPQEAAHIRVEFQGRRSCLSPEGPRHSAEGMSGILIRLHVLNSVKCIAEST